jgi:hypothetical protein
MPKHQPKTSLILILLLAAVLSLGGCKRQDTKTSSPPDAKQFIPAVGGGTSPLPTPGVADSPVTP